MAGSIDALMVKDWKIAYSHNPEGFMILHCEFANRDPITLAFAPDELGRIAATIAEALRNPPTKPTRN